MGKIKFRIDQNQSAAPYDIKCWPLSTGPDATLITRKRIYNYFYEMIIVRESFLLLKFFYCQVAGNLSFSLGGRKTNPR